MAKIEHTPEPRLPEGVPAMLVVGKVSKVMLVSTTSSDADVAAAVDAILAVHEGQASISSVG